MKSQTGQGLGYSCRCYFEAPVTVSASLSCHLHVFAADPTPLTGLTVALTWLAGGELQLCYRWQLAPEAGASLLLPPTLADASEVAGPTDGLWQHSCAELFIALPGAPAYLEYNFAPSGQWAAYAFSAYRQRQEVPLPAPRIQCRRTAAELLLEAVLPVADLPAPFAQAAQWQLGLTAVVESTAGALSYWALHHPGERPDFHHRGGMIATLGLPLPSP